jgi:peptide/nickel transport system ATP-binding protein
MSLLDIRNLSVEFTTDSHGVARVLRDVSFTVEAGRSVALVGESGSGKSVTARAILGLLEANARVTSGEILFEGRDVVGLSERELRSLRGDKISLVLQDAMTSLNPSHTIGRQVAESLRVHRGVKKALAWREAVNLLDRVGIEGPDVQAKRYPHQLSGGMRQRVVIAGALACRPQLLIADEPTTALDVTTQAQVLELLREMAREEGSALLLITHDLGVVSDMAEDVVVLYAGEVLETGSVGATLDHPAHPYTRGLIASLPSRALRGQPLVGIPGQIPPLDNLPSGCVFHPRCQHAIATCARTHPSLAPVDGSGHLSACPVTLSSPSKASLATENENVHHLSAVRSAPRTVPLAALVDSPLLEVSSLRKEFSSRGILPGKSRGAVVAVDDVSFTVRQGTTLGIVGESGSGKSTIARLIARLLEPTSGSVRIGGEDLTQLRGEALRRRRRDIQIVFQDPLGSFDPRRRIDSALKEPLRAFDLPHDGDRVEELLDLVGLPGSYARRAPHQLSGGQRQRVAIARALALSPKVLICDEAVASLDASIQAQVINLLEELQERLSLTYVFISHDLSLVRHISDTIVVMWHGVAVEQGSAEAVIDSPTHAYTRSLLAAIPGSHRQREASSTAPLVRAPSKRVSSIGGASCRSEVVATSQGEAS